MITPMPRPALPPFALLLLALAGPLSAQTDPRLQDAVRLAQEGQGDSARTMVTRILAATPASDSLYPQVLYTFGLIAADVDERRRHMSRIAIEYANSPWADDALLQLGYLDYASSNPAGAARQFDLLKSDYPDSPLIAPASYWAARAYFDLRRTGEACAWVATGIERVGDDVETRNQLTWYQGRCAAAARDSAKADSARAVAATPAAPTSAPPPPPAPGPTRKGFAVQVGAVNTQAAADKLVGDLRAAKLTGYVVKDRGMFKVRVGPYPDRTAAQAVLPNVRRAVGGSPFIVQEP
jgi:sporulation related protein